MKCKICKQEHSMMLLGECIMCIIKQRDVIRLQRDRLRDFALEIACQRPEKPDHWSSCGQCDNNIQQAHELLEEML